MTTTKYKRVLLKLSGEAFGGSAEFGIDASVLAMIANQIKHVIEIGASIAVVVGGQIQINDDLNNYIFEEDFVSLDHPSRDCDWWIRASHSCVDAAGEKPIDVG